ncbi:MAG: 1,4-beta-xylanase [Lachnospiraceae bacterium]|nr:1,4-beta-xylanase [Lachnospiraceae bacterium]
MAGYLFVHFTDEHAEGEQIYFALSKDGLHYEDLHGGKPFLRLDIGEMGVRDPFILRGVHGEGFFIIGTDLRIANGKGWGVAQYEGSRNLVIWHSNDLLHWSEPKLVEVGIPTAGCVWAPEAVYDEVRDAYMIFFASMVKEETDTEPKQKIYTVYTKDFIEFTKAEKYIERENHVIDTTMIYEGGKYYRYSKDETTKRILCDCGEQLHGEFAQVSSDVLENLPGVEGPIIFPLGEKKWCLMVDRFATGGGYLPLITEDLASGKFRILDESEYDMDEIKKRHGSILVITDEEYERLTQLR